MFFKLEYLNVSIVLYNTNLKLLERSVISLLRTKLNIKILLVDNSESDYLKTIKSLEPNIINYIHTGKNLGYGCANNIAIRESIN
ncbi:MAG: glycosyltransferase family 2 protein, partial [Minisyncoccia bacterium]